MVALLLRYPELGSVRVLPSQAVLTLSFWLREAPEPAACAQFERRVRQALRMLSRLEGHGYMREVGLTLRGQGPLHVLEVRRDLESLAAEEFGIILGLVRQAFGGIVVVEGEAYAGDGDEYDADLTIAHGLDQAKRVRQGEELVGFRQDGRVLVFSAA